MFYLLAFADSKPSVVEFPDLENCSKFRQITGFPFAFRATHPPPPPKKMQLDNSERSRSPNDTGERAAGDDDKVNGDRLADHVCRMIISADDTVDEAASGGRDSATKSVVNVADYMVSFMNFVEPTSRALQV